MAGYSTTARLALMLGLALNAGCGTWLGNPKNPDPDKTKPSGNSMVTLSIQGSLPDSALHLTAAEIQVVGRSGEVSGILTLSTARLALKEIQLKLDGADTGERQEFEGPYVVDLLTSSVTPDPGPIEIPGGTYRSIKLKLAKLEKDDAEGVVSEGDPLIGRSIQLTGTYKATGGVAQTVTMDFDLDEEFKLGASSGFAGMAVAEDRTNPIIIAFHVDEWFDFSGAEADFADVGTSAIVLTKDGGEKAKKVREAIKENVKASARFGKDEDGDGKLGGGERSDD